MKLAQFIETEMEAILLAWDEFARALPAGASMEAAGIRDHAREILQAVCRDLESAQSREQEIRKSTGHAPPMNADQTAAQTHALLRARTGFDINHMASEYRALRACVLRLWFDSSTPSSLDLTEVTRFNEAIDEALCESVSFFSAEVDRARNLLLGALGHDMRTPLSAIQMTAHHLKRLNVGEEVSVAAGRLIRSGAIIKSLLDDLTAFNRTQLGLGIAISVVEVDLREVFESQLQQIQLAHPGCEVVLHTQGDLHGHWDAQRLEQVLTNLVVNAFRYGSSASPVQVRLTGVAEEIVLSVENEGREGKSISTEVLAQLFDPLRRGGDRPYHEEGSLGLGLYICREIVLAHKGSIAAESTNSRTTFTVRIPRHVDAAPVA